MSLETVEVASSVGGLERLKESLAWKDILRELEAWLIGFDIELDSIVSGAADENPTTASVLMRLGDLNGRKQAVKYFMALPDVLIDIRKQTTKEEAKDARDQSTDNPTA